jgi:uncharacterized protein YkwD
VRGVVKSLRVLSTGSRLPHLAAIGSVVLLLGLVPTAPAQADAAGQTREAVIAQYQAVLLPALEVPNDWNGAFDSCTTGTTSAQYQAATLASINYLRALAGVPAVSLDTDKNAFAQAAALIMGAQHALSHQPPAEWRCWTDLGFAGAGMSNLYLGRTGAGAMVGYTVDPGPNNTLVGHRRWLLDSQAVSMGTGDTATSNALLVIAGPTVAPSIQWTPWPAAGYFPWQLEPEGRWSLTMPGADFSSATVSMTSAGAPLQLSVNPPVNGYGDNTLSWEVSLPSRGDSRHPTDVAVEVSVAGIRLPDGSTVTHDYTVNLVDAAPHTPPSEPSVLHATRSGRSIRIDLQASDDSGGEQVTYLVKAIPSGRGSKGLPARTCTTTESTCTITSTKPRVTYRLVTVALNSIGTSDSTEAWAWPVHR